jgi:hypothetical protein
MQEFVNFTKNIALIGGACFAACVTRVTGASLRRLAADCCGFDYS